MEGGSGDKNDSELTSSLVSARSPLAIVFISSSSDDFSRLVTRRSTSDSLDPSAIDSCPSLPSFSFFILPLFSAFDGFLENQPGVDLAALLTTTEKFNDPFEVK